MYNAFFGGTLILAVLEKQFLIFVQLIRLHDVSWIKMNVKIRENDSYDAKIEVEKMFSTKLSLEVTVLINLENYCKFITLQNSN